MDNGFYPGRFQRWEPFVSKSNTVFDFVKIIGQKLMAKIPRRAIHGPWTAGLFVKSYAKAAAFLPQVALSSWIHHMRMFAACIDNGRNLRDIFSDNILMLHRHQREIDARHRPHLTRPKAGGIYNMLRMNRAFIRHKIPGAIGPLCGGEHFAMSLDMRPAHSSGLGIGMGCARRVEMPVKRIIEPTNDPIDIGHRGNLGDLVRSDNFGL